MLSHTKSVFKRYNHHMNRKISPLAFFGVPIFIILVVLAVKLFPGHKENQAASVPNPEIVATSSSTSSPKKAYISVLPGSIRQGDPALIEINGVSSISKVKSVTLNGKRLPLFTFGSKPSALVGVGLRDRTGAYPIVAMLADGTILKKSLSVVSRPVAKEELGIPGKLGGNTAAGEQNVVSSLSSDNKEIAGVSSSPSKLWSGDFVYPVPEPIVITDPYGDTRLSGSLDIPHKGADFKAPTGTPISAINSGVVKFAKFLTSYGNTVIVDHGQGILSFYLHMSEIDVSPGETVAKGQLLGKSGDTGFAEGAHLHLSIRVDDVSIDPIAFFALLGSK